jgi:hypothetical protein
MCIKGDQGGFLVNPFTIKIKLEKEYNATNPLISQF